MSNLVRVYFPVTDGTGKPCESERHTHPPECVAVIRLVDLPESEGFRVCAECLGKYATEVYLNKNTDLRLAFVVEPC